jgi:hypothetical protein
MGNTRQGIDKELDVIRIQLLMMIKEATNRLPGVATVEHTVAELQRIAHQLDRGGVADTALVLKPWRSTRLCEQHRIDRIDLVTREVMGVKKAAEIVDMVPSLQGATGNTQELAGEFTGMPVAASATVVP